MISTWKREFLLRSPEIISTRASDEEVERREQALCEKIGVFGSTDCEIKLQISGIKIHDNGKNYKFDSSAVQLRKHCKTTI